MVTDDGGRLILYNFLYLHFMFLDKPMVVYLQFLVVKMLVCRYH